MKLESIKEKLTAPYAINPMLRKNPCFKTTHLTEYPNPFGKNKYANVKSKYRTNTVSKISSE
jgi:hypothetical protein